jgi:hypothetical protein
MFKLIIQKPAADDLEKLIKAGGASKQYAARILAFLQEAKGRQDWLGEFLTRKFQNDEFNIDKYVEFWDAGLDMWRASLFEHDFTRHKKWNMPYRILYAYDLSCQTFRVLGVVSRNFNYQADHEFTQRIRRTYDDLALPKHRVDRRGNSGHGNKSN